MDLRQIGCLYVNWIELISVWGPVAVLFMIAMDLWFSERYKLLVMQPVKDFVA
jgi:hypothetical protein